MRKQTWWRRRGRSPSRGWPGPSWCPASARSRTIVEHLADELGVERGGDLVEQQQRRAGAQRPDQRGPLLLAAGEPVGVLVGLVGQPELREQLAGPGLGLAAATGRAPGAAPGCSCPARSGAGRGCRPGRPCPIRRRTARAVDPRVGDLPALEADHAVVDRPRAGSGSAAAWTCPSPTSRSGRPRRAGCTVRSTSASTTRSPYDLRSVGRPRAAASAHRRPRPLALGIARRRSQSVNRASGIVSATKKQRDHDERRVVEVVVAVVLGREHAPRRRPMAATSAVSFCSETKSLSSGGTTRRTACGTTT